MRIQSTTQHFVTGKNGLVVTALLVAFSALNPGKVNAASIISNPVSGSTEPTQIFNAPLDGQTSTQNGDFTITRSGGNSTLGNGIDELTTWGFDFTNAPNLNKFLNSGRLKFALLTLTLSPKSGLITTDRLGIPGVGSIRVPQIAGIPAVGKIGTVQLDLLKNGFTSAGILGSLQSTVGSSIGLGGGQTFTVSNAENVIPFSYADDSIVSFAQLKLETVPEPTSTLGFLALGIVGMGSLRRKRQSEIK
ncbi:PEP-CTERM sorting domain-containing protein [Lusitaniella coriacea LEGE 07157]|uniref:PEP-CTERM sorting domain-containing protein n=1 Tax=Lusitaniella coriacea LEGE 07157 TaxID=945747 RepID=A0A8J7DWQ9_9CYAN|nr:PEP-CTERM sorting domain-containing protein [Lusitaniella coriacea]MBE9116616.1 PEP-CTERM sorting domain-containing protein [Lusitaniella coriacea LEGE 07157]